jgi:hypothetical protein
MNPFLALDVGCARNLSSAIEGARRGGGPAAANRGLVAPVDLGDLEAGRDLALVRTQSSLARCHECNYFLCPRRRHRTCCEPDCQLGALCTEAQAYGLTGDGRALPRKLRPACGVRTRRGELCVARVVPGKVQDARWPVDWTQDR